MFHIPIVAGLHAIVKGDGRHSAFIPPTQPIDEVRAGGLMRGMQVLETEAQKVLLANIAMADGVLRECEIRTVGAIVSALDGVGELRRSETLKQLQYLLKTDVDLAVRSLQDLPNRRRQKLVQLLWVMAICDGELHPSEEAMIYNFADRLGIDRASVAAQQPDF